MTTPQQLELPFFSSIQYAAAYPLRATSKLENNVYSAVRYTIQQMVYSGAEFEVDKNIHIPIDVRSEAKLRNIDDWFTLYRNIERAMNKVSKNAYKERIILDNAEDKEKYIEVAIVTTTHYNAESGVITVTVNADFVKYYVAMLLSRPEIQVPREFDAFARSSYTYPFSRWLFGQIAILQKNNENPPYKISISLEDLMAFVPPSSASIRPSSYSRDIISSVIEDMNENEFCPVTIINPHNIVSRRTGRRIAEFTFAVEMRPLGANKYPLLTAISDSGLINESSVPSRDYLHKRLQKLGFAESSWSKLDNQPAVCWKVILYTLVKVKEHAHDATPFNPGAYIQGMLKRRSEQALLKDKNIKGLALDVLRKAPEFVDEVIIASAGVRTAADQFLAMAIQNRPVPKQTANNNQFLREYLDKHKDVKKSP